MADETEQLMRKALAVKRGETPLDSLPKDEREKVRKVLRSTGEAKMRVFAEAQRPQTRRFGQRAPQAQLRRARTA